MAQSRIRIVDVTDALGLSTVTVSKVFVMLSLNALSHEVNKKR